MLGDQVGGQALGAHSLRRFRAKRRNERVKLVASAFDRISTLVVAGAAIAPFFQNQALKPGYAYWIVVAVVLHLLGQTSLSFLRDDS